MEIRLLSTLEDAEKYRRLRLESLQESPEAFASSYEEEKDVSIEAIRNEFQGNDSFTYGAFEDTQLVGIITLYKDKLYKLSHRAHLGAMYVLPEKRSAKVGKALMEVAIEKAKELPGIEQVYLAVVSTNEPAKRLYASLGFEVFGTEKKGLRLDSDTYYDVDFMILYL